MVTTRENWEKRREEIFNGFKEAEAEFRGKARELDIEYALSRAKFKAGDIISNGRTALRIDRVEVPDEGWNFIEPCPVYFGEVLSGKGRSATGKFRRLDGGRQDGYELVSE